MCCKTMFNNQILQLVLNHYSFVLDLSNQAEFSKGVPHIDMPVLADQQKVTFTGC